MRSAGVSGTFVIVSFSTYKRKPYIELDPRSSNAAQEKGVILGKPYPIIANRAKQTDCPTHIIIVRYIVARAGQRSDPTFHSTLSKFVVDVANPADDLAS